MRFNPERGGEEEFTPESGNNGFTQWQKVSPEVRGRFLVKESHRWPPVEGKDGASPEAKNLARISSILAVEAAKARER